MPDDLTQQGTARERRVDLAEPPADPSSGLTVEAWLARAAGRWPERPALAGVDDERPLTHAGLRALVAEGAERLRAAGVGPGDVVLLALPDGPMAITALLCVASVATVMPVGVREQAEEYARILDEVPVRAILMEERPQAPLTRLAEERGITLLRAAPRRDVPGAFQLSVLRPAASRPERPLEADDDALYTLTSGTTSVPKIVAIGHASLWASMESSRAWFGLSERDRSLCLMPIAHLHSLIRCSLPVLAAGGSVTWAPGFDASRLPDWLDRVEPTFISAAPAVHRKLLAACDAAAWQPRGEPVRVFAASSDKLDTTTVQRLEARFGARVVQLYGLSETAPLIAATPYDGSRVPVGSTGRVNPAWTVECLGEDGRPVAPGELGEIAVSGGFVNRLVGRSGTHLQRFDDAGRFLTGDLGRLDADGALFVEGRVDDVINRGGQKINPAAVEAAFATLPAVRAVVAFAMPDPVLGSRVAVAIELRDGARVTPDDLLDQAGRNLRSYMVPERVYISEAIPRTPLGKMSRTELAAHYAAAGAGDAAAGPGDAGAADGRARPSGQSGPDARDGAPSAPDDVLAAVLDIYRRVLRRDDVDPDIDFFDLGGDSLHSLYLHLEIEERFGVTVQPATFARITSARSLAGYLALLSGSQPRGRLVAAQTGDGRLPLIITHGIDGQYNLLASTMARLGVAPGVPILALDSAGPEILEGEPRSMADLAPGYAELVREGVAGPYAVAGYSLGSHVAVATAISLVAQHATVHLLVVIDDDAELVRRNFGLASRGPATRTLAGYYRHAVDLDPVGHYPGRIVLIRCEEDEAEHRSDRTAGWGEVALGGVTDIVVPGNHHSMVRETAVPTLARVLVDQLEAAPARPAVQVMQVDDGRLLRRRARLAHVQGDRAAEIAAYREAIAIDRDQPSWAYENLSEALLAAGDRDGARRALEEALRRDPWPLSIELRFGPSWVARGMRGEIMRAYKRSRGLPSDHPSVLAQRGQMAAIAGHLDEAERLYRVGLAMAPAHHVLHVKLATLLNRRGRFAEAARVFADANERTPGLGGYIMLEAQSYLDAGEPGRALEALDRAPGVVEYAPRGVLVRGLVLEALGRDEEARAALLKAAEIHPDGSAPAREAKDALARLGRRAEATTWSGRAASSSGA